MGQTVLGRIRAGNPDIRHARSDERGYALLDVGAAGVQASFRGTLHPARPESVLREQACFWIEAGRAGVQAA